MHVIVTTDGSKQSLTAARSFKSFADPTAVETVSVLAVVRPLAAVAFADEISGGAGGRRQVEQQSFRDEAKAAVARVAEEFADWGPTVRQKVRSGSPANEIIKAAEAYGAGLIVIASGGRGLSSSVLVGSTAQKVQHYAPCPVLVVRPTPRKKKG